MAESSAAVSCSMISKLIGLRLHLQGEHAQLTLHVFDIELLLDLLRVPAFKAQQVFEKLVAGNMVTGVQVGILCPLLLAPSHLQSYVHLHNCIPASYTCIPASFPFLIYPRLAASDGASACSNLQNLDNTGISH